MGGLSWAELTRRRAIPGAGVFLAMTRRCPLHCAHCSTASTMKSPQSDDDYYRRFVGTFSKANHPEVVWFSGGEPILRHKLVRELASECQELGATTVITTGLYFGRTGRIAAPIWKTLETMDFVTVSVDSWHEEEVPRERSFACFEQMLERGMSVGLQATGRDENDPYLQALIPNVQERFGDQIGIYVALLKPTGRALALIDPLSPVQHDPDDGRPAPQGCGGLSWPVFGFGDHVANACCNQEAMDTRPDHLNLPLDWQQITRSLQNDPVLRVINVLGPRVLAYEHDGTQSPDQDYCTKCQSLANRENLNQTAATILARSSWPILEAVTSALRVEAGDPTLGQRKYANYAEWGV